MVNIQGARIHQLSSTAFAVQLEKLDQDASKDFENNVIILYSKTEEDCTSWVEKLRTASIRTVEGEYEVGNIIGEGGFAIVRVGRCRKTGELRAIKTIEKEEAHAQLYGREIAIIKRVNHPNIVKTYDVFETENEIHIVMEYMKGGMLYESIEDGIRFHEQDVVQIMREILDGIIYLHSQGIVHRDLKPENVLCTSSTLPFHVKISDFGLSSIADIAEMKEKKVLMCTMIGTPEFIAPEIANREPYTEKVDVWALGMLCYNTITRRLPLDENKDMLLQIRKGVTLTFPEEEWALYGEEVKSFMRAVLCTDPEKRLSPFGCLVHPWLDTIKERKGMSTKIGAHGRFSSFFVTRTNTDGSLAGVDSVGWKESVHRNAVIESGIRTPKKRWAVAFAAVTAVNRFKWLVTPRRANTNPRHSSQSSSARTKERILSGQASINSASRDVSASQISFVDEGVSIRLEPQTIDDEIFSQRHKLEFADGSGDGSSNKFSSFFRGLQGRNTLTQEEQCVQSAGVRARTPEATIDGPKSAPAFMIGKESHGKNSYSDGRKSLLKSRLMNSITRKASNKFAPVRKLSKRLLGKNENKGAAGPSPLAAGALDLELGLGKLGVTEVDESGVVQLEETEANDGDGCNEGVDKPKKRKHKKKVEAVVSPCTPSTQGGHIFEK